MTRVKYSTTLQEELLRKTKALAKAQGLAGANDIIEKALEMYFQLQNTQIWEKEIGNGKYQIVTIGNGHTCLDYVDKRVLIDAVSDTDVLLTDGYCCAMHF